MTAFNGQSVRIAMFDEMLFTIPFAAVVETGTYTGETTEFFLNRTSVPVHTVELDHDRAQAVAARLSSYPAAHVVCGDSRAFLADLASSASFPRENVFFYLDAHWNEDLPLQDEVSQVVACWRHSAIMIDDFQVPDDSGYGFDSYGAHKTLCLEYLGEQISGLPVYFPASPSTEETGHRRGCVVIGTDDVIMLALDRVTMLRRWSC
jgi:hypothetical protein